MLHFNKIVEKLCNQQYDEELTHLLESETFYNEETEDYNSLGILYYYIFAQIPESYYFNQILSRLTLAFDLN